jgi:hypothetical protein
MPNWPVLANAISRRHTLPHHFHPMPCPQLPRRGEFFGGGQMQSDVDLAVHYRKEADKFSELARSAPPGVFRDVFHETAVRFLRMARVLERQRSQPSLQTTT